mmetsp:Transcript_13915/g.35069  ORF Transcript_13915/g.35069 Transcript_13915/m.35069 type:complete len:262 (+) Transcript_13915:187-972(+)
MSRICICNLSAANAAWAISHSGRTGQLHAGRGKSGASEGPGLSTKRSWRGNPSALEPRPVASPEFRSSRRGIKLQAINPALVNWPTQVVTGVNIYAGLLYIALLSASSLQWPGKLIRKIRTSRAEILLLPVALAYLALLCLSWQPDTVRILFPGSLQAGLASGFNPQFFPNLAGISHLFSRCGITAASMWIHLLAMNLFVAVQICKDGYNRNVIAFHSVLLCVISGVLGCLSHAITKLLSRKRVDMEEADGYTMFTFRGRK